MGSLPFGAVVCCSYGQTYPSICQGREYRQGRPPDRDDLSVGCLLVHERWLWRLGVCWSPHTLCSIVLLRRNLVLLRWSLLLLLLLPLVILVLLLMMILVIHLWLVDVFVVRVLILLSVLHVLCMVLRRRLLLLLGVRQVLVCMVFPTYHSRPLPAAILLLKMLSVHCTVPRRGSRPGRPPPDRRALVRRRPVVVIGGQEMSFLRPGTGSSCAAAAADRPPLLLACLALSVAGPVCRRSHVVGRGEITAAVAFVPPLRLSCPLRLSGRFLWHRTNKKVKALPCGVVVTFIKSVLLSTLVWPSQTRNFGIGA